MTATLRPGTPCSFISRARSTLCSMAAMSAEGALDTGDASVIASTGTRRDKRSKGPPPIGERPGYVVARHEVAGRLPTKSFGRAGLRLRAHAPPPRATIPVRAGPSTARSHLPHRHRDHRRARGGRIAHGHGGHRRGELAQPADDLTALAPAGHAPPRRATASSGETSAPDARPAALGRRRRDHMRSIRLPSSCALFVIVMGTLMTSSTGRAYTLTSYEW